MANEIVFRNGLKIKGSLPSGAGDPILTRDALTGVIGEGGSSTAPGADTQVIFNDGGVLGADTGLIFNKATDTLTAGRFVGVPTASQTGLNIGTYAGDPTNTVGDLWYNSTTNVFSVRHLGGPFALVLASNLGSVNNSVPYLTSSTTQPILSQTNQFTYTSSTRVLNVGILSAAHSTEAGLRLNNVAADPASLSNGYMWYNSTAHQLKARINGTTVALNTFWPLTGTGTLIGDTIITGGSTERDITIRTADASTFPNTRLYLQKAGGTSSLTSRTSANDRSELQVAPTQLTLYSGDVSTNSQVVLTPAGVTLTGTLVTLSGSNGVVASNKILANGHTSSDAPLNLLPFPGNPSLLNNGDIWYNETTHAIMARINGANVDLGAGGGGGISGLTTNRIPYATSATTLGDDSALTWDPTNNKLGVNTGIYLFATDVTTSGWYNIYYGKNPGNTTATGLMNIGIGITTLNALTTGSFNLMIGRDAGTDITTGSNNVGLGESALSSITTTSENTAVGNEAMSAVTTGTANIGIGAYTFTTSPSPGNYNIAIGRSTGNGGYTGSYGVFIGHNITPPTTSGNGQLSIQNAIYGKNNTGTGSTNSTGNIGFYNSTPGTVNGIDFSSTVRLHLKTTGNCFFALDSGAGGAVLFNNSGQSVDNRIWTAGNASSSFHIRPITDAGASVAVDTVFAITRDINIGVGVQSWGTSATKTVAVGNGTAPSTSVTDAFQMYANDIVAGNSAPHIRTESGDIIKLYSIGSWGTPTGTLTRTTFDTTTVTLSQLAERVAALISDLKTGHQLLKA